MKARNMLVSLAVATLAGAVGAAASETDLAWIGDLPGLSVFARKTTGAVSKTVYTVSGSPEETFAAVRRGLGERGWTIESSKASSLPGIGSQKLTARKAGSRVEIRLSQLGDSSHLSVELTPGGGDPRASGSSEARAPAPAAPSATTGRTFGRRSASYDCGEGGDVTINNSGAAVTVRGRCEDVTVNGGGNAITLEGDCEDLTINSASNEVRVDAAIDTITIDGSSNTVSWSAARNATGPRIRDNGTNNAVRRH
jgi:hypothetical protein